MLMQGEGLSQQCTLLDRAQAAHWQCWILQCPPQSPRCHGVGVWSLNKDIFEKASYASRVA
jgi:hypothetical protein